MIYLIGGPPRCGKTTLARRLAGLTGASVVPVDYLGSVVYHYLSDAERAARFPLLDGSTAAIYARHTTEEIVGHYRQIARTLWPAIQVYSHFALAHGQAVILEGYHIEPALMDEFSGSEGTMGQVEDAQSEHGREMVHRGTGYALAHRGDARIRAVFLYKQNEQEIAAHLTAGADEHDWVMRERLPSETLRGIAAMIGRYSRFIKDDAARYGLPAFAMDGCYAERLDDVLAYLLGGHGLPLEAP
jgi:2-phosphoglycerate kinase